jgi:hypothetical protein
MGASVKFYVSDCKAVLEPDPFLTVLAVFFLLWAKYTASTKDIDTIACYPLDAVIYMLTRAGYICFLLLAFFFHSRI